MIKTQILHLVILVQSLFSLVIVMALQVLNLPPHVSSLSLDEFNLLVHVTGLLPQLDVLIAFLVALFPESAELEELLVENPLGPLQLVLQVHVLLALLTEEVLEVFLLLAVVSDLVHASVDSAPVFHFGPDLVVGEHPVPVLHGEDFIVDSIVVPFLRLQVVQLLPQFRNQLVFVRRPDSHGVSHLGLSHSVIRVFLILVQLNIWGGYIVIVKHKCKR